MTIQDIAILRLRRQHIDGLHAEETPLELTKYMGAMQAQDYYGSLWALALRTQGTEKDIIRAIEAREIIRTWPQRGTLHFVPAEDARWLVSLSAERLLKGAKSRREQLGLEDPVLLASKTVVAEALKGGRMLSRPEVMDILEEAGISTKAGRGYHILWYLSQTGVTFIGPMKGKQQTVALLDEQVPHHKSLTRQQGIIELTKRYFTSHGPATIQDFMWWAGLTTLDAKTGLEANKSLLVSEKVEAKEYWMARELLNQTATSTDSFLLPGFDEFLLGYKDRTPVLHPDNAQKVVPGGNGMFLPTIIIDGRVVGTWKRIIRKSHVVIELNPFENLTRAHLKSLQQAADTYSRFIGLPAVIERT